MENSKNSRKSEPLVIERPRLWIELSDEELEEELLSFELDLMSDWAYDDGQEDFYADI